MNDAGPSLLNPWSNVEDACGSYTYHNQSIYFCMCKNVFSVRDKQFMMRYILFSVGYFEIENNHANYRLKNNAIPHYFSVGSLRDCF